MEIEGTGVDAAKRIVELEARLDQSKEEYMKLKAKEERANAKCDKLKERLDSEERKWREKWWEAELDRRKLEIDLKVAAAKRVEDADANLLKISELVGKIGVLDAEIHSLSSRLGADNQAKRAREADNRKVEEKITELIRKIDVLEKEKAERGAEKKRISEKVKALESEKRELTEKMERMEAEKAALNDKTWELIQKEIMGSSVVNSREDVGILGTPTPQNQGLGSSVEKWGGAKKHKVGGHSVGRPKWESASEMLNAFTTNDELCMMSVCALYRKHKSLGSWKNCSSSDNKVFKPIHESMGMALVKLLTNGDPEGKMKISLAKFKRAHSLDLEECRLIARQYHMELFQIYNNNLDPLFMPGEC